MTAAGAILMLLGAVLLVTFGSFAALLLGVRDTAGLVVASMVAAAAQLVLLAQLLSFVGAWADAGVLAAQALTTALVVALAARRGLLRDLPRRLRDRVDRAAGGAVAEAAGDIVLRLLLPLVVLCLMIQAYLAVSYAPGTWDAMLYHLARAAYWIQNGSIEVYEHATVRQASFPVNAEVLQGWVLMLSQGDALVQLVQFSASLGLAAFAFAAARDTGFSRRQSLYASVVMLAVPTVVAQASSTQNDLIVAFFAAAGALFAARWLRGGARGDLVLLGLAAGLTVGTKTTGMMAVFGLFAVCALYLRRTPRRLLPLAASVAAGVLALGAFAYVQNLLGGYGFTGPESLDQFRVHSPGEVPENAVKIVWTALMSIPVISLTPVEDVVAGAFASIFSGVENFEGLAYTHFFFDVRHLHAENNAGWGLVGLFLLLPAFIVTLRERERDRFFFAAVAALTLLALVASVRYNVWITRFTLVAGVVAIPLAAALVRGGVSRALVALVVAASIVPMSVYNFNKPFPLIPQGSYRPDNRAEEMAREAPFELIAIKTVDRYVAEDARLGFAGTEDAWEYPFFGPNLGRTMVKLDLDELQHETTSEMLGNHRLDAILISGDISRWAGQPHQLVISPMHALVLPPGRLR